MNILPLIIIAGGAAYMLKALHTQDTASKLSVRIAGLTDWVITLYETKFKTVVNITNPTGRELTLQEISLRFSFGGYNVGSVYLSGQPITIPARTTRTITLPVALSNAGNVLALLQAIHNGQPTTIQITGYAKANGFISEINQTVNL